MSTTRERLESAVEQGPDEPSRYSVLADHLLEMGDLRGELIALHLSGAAPDRAHQLEQQLAAEGDHRSYIWRWGYVHFAVTHETRRRGTLTEMLANPSFRFLRGLSVDDDDLGGLGRAMRANPLSLLNSLYLEVEDMDLSELQSLPNLELLSVQFGIDGERLRGEVSLPKLRALRVPSFPEGGVQSLVERYSDALTSMEFEIHDSWLDEESLSHVLLPCTALEELTLSACVVDEPFLESLLAFPLRNTLRRLSFPDTELTEAAQERLVCFRTQWPQLKIRHQPSDD